MHHRSILRSFPFLFRPLAYLSNLAPPHCSDYEKAYELETDEDNLKDIKLKVKKVRRVIALLCACVYVCFLCLCWLVANASGTDCM